MDHVLKHVAAGIVPVKSPVDYAIPAELAGLGLALEGLPIDVLGVAVGRNRPHPAAIRSVAEVVRMDGRNCSESFGGGQFARFRQRRAARGLDPDLDDAARACPSRSHAPCMLGAPRPGLFLVNVLSRLDSPPAG